VEDRVVQTAMRLVVEPIFEADFHDCSYGSHSRRSRMPLKINDLPHSVFVNIKPIESTAYAFYAVRNAASFELNC
jgi:hypothetical protein